MAPRSAEVEELCRLLSGWKRPLILAGGGVVAAGAEAELARLAERLGAPVLHTAMGKCALPSSHPLAAGMPWTRATSDLSNMGSLFSPLFAAADGLLAVGCRFTQMATGNWLLRPPPQLAQIDVDPREIGRHYPVTLGIHADAQAALLGVLDALPRKNRAAWAPAAKRHVGDEPWRLPGMELLGELRRRLPADAIISADVTRLAYILMAEFPLDRPRSFLHPAGAVAMGFGIPAALGAKAAFPERAVVAVVGDGGFLMSGMELATAAQERLPIVVVLVNDNSLTLIRATQHARYADRFIAVDLQNPDFGLFARAFGANYHHTHDDADFGRALSAALRSDATTMIEVRPGDALAKPPSSCLWLAARSGTVIGSPRRGSRGAGATDEATGYGNGLPFGTCRVLSRATESTAGGFMVRLLCRAFAPAVLALLLAPAARADEKKDTKKEDPYADMIGKPAPELAGGDYSLNGKVTKLADLKGKVVLVDFWAVWCGPCVATFPHLRDWNKEFKDKGLEIVGVTTYYEKIGFDKEAGKIKRLDDKMTKDQEHEMLKEFAAHHKLEHRLMTLSKEDSKKAYDDYKVKGIPTVVLIDRKGVVRMVKVGSGEENAKALEGMIKKLIDEK